MKLPALNGRLLEVRAASMHTHIEPGRGELTVTGSASVNEDEETVQVRAHAKGLWFMAGGMHLELPHGSRVRIEVEHGAMHAEGLKECELDYATGSGAVHIEGCQGRVRVRTKSGSVNMEHHRGSFDVETLSGAIHLDIVDLVAGAHKARTAAGALNAELDKRIRAWIDARAIMGSVRSHARSYNDAVVLITLLSDVGAVRVKQAQGKHKPQPTAPQTLDAILAAVASGELAVDAAEILIERLEKKS